MVHPESVAKILGSLDISKAMGPDGVHPRLLRYLSENNSFVDAVVLLFSACASEQYIPEVWKTATVGGGVTSVYVRLCPVLFGFYETTDVVFGTLADIDDLQNNT